MLFDAKIEMKVEMPAADKGKGNGACQRSGFDRRVGEDRRQAYDLNYLAVVGRDRRASNERRKTGELRAGWVRVNQWSSVCVEEVPLSRPHADEPSLNVYEIR